MVETIHLRLWKELVFKLLRYVLSETLMIFHNDDCIRDNVNGRDEVHDDDDSDDHKHV